MCCGGSSGDRYLSSRGRGGTSSGDLSFRTAHNTCDRWGRDGHGATSTSLGSDGSTVRTSGTSHNIDIASVPRSRITSREGQSARLKSRVFRTEAYGTAGSGQDGHIPAHNTGAALKLQLATLSTVLSVSPSADGGGSTHIRLACAGWRCEDRMSPRSRSKPFPLQRIDQGRPCRLARSGAAPGSCCRDGRARPRDRHRRPQRVDGQAAAGRRDLFGEGA